MGLGKGNPPDQVPQMVPGAQSSREPWGDGDTCVRIGSWGGGSGVIYIPTLDSLWRATGAGHSIGTSACDFGRSPW